MFMIVLLQVCSGTIPWGLGARGAHHNDNLWPRRQDFGVALHESNTHKYNVVPLSGLSLASWAVPSMHPATLSLVMRYMYIIIIMYVVMVKVGIDKRSGKWGKQKAYALNIQHLILVALGTTAQNHCGVLFLGASAPKQIHGIHCIVCHVSGTKWPVHGQRLMQHAMRWDPPFLSCYLLS